MTDKQIHVAINGAGGRMGQRLIALSGADERFQLACAIEAEGHPFIGKEIAGVRYEDQLTPGVDVVIDFSLPAGTQRILAQAMNSKIPMVIGTTGCSAELQLAIDEAAKVIPIIHAANYSVGVNVLLKLLAEAACRLGSEYDIEIVEAHHRFKKDAPSGTALAMAKSICDATARDMGTALRHGRSGECPRVEGEIGMHAVRVGDTVGEHSAYFGTLGETVTLSHSAHSRDTFAMGALRAAVWLVGKSAGMYDMNDVLFGG